MPVSNIIALGAGLVAAGALVWCWILDRRLKAAMARDPGLERLAEAGDVVGLAKAVEGRLTSLEEADGQRRADDAALAERLSRAVRHVGLVRYDAFSNTAGAQSFSLAMLDDEGDGFVMTSIYGRGEYRMYAKPIVGRASTYSLTAEETGAISDAYAGGGLGEADARRS